MAVNVETVEPYRADWRRGRLTSLLTTVDHKRIGLMYIWTSLFFFAFGGILALLLRTQLATPNEHFLTKGSYNAVLTIHGTTMIFLVIVPILAGFGNFLVPLMIGARDMAFPRLNALSYWLYLLGGIVILMSFFAKHGPAQAGWTSYVPLSTLHEPGQRPGPVDPRAAHPFDLVARRRDQHRRDRAQHANARHVVDAHPALRLGDRHLRVAADHRAPDALGRPDDDAARSPGRNALLRSGARRQPAPLPARVLVLRPPRGLHHDPARDGDHLGGPPRLLAQADLRLQGSRHLDRGHRVLLAARLGAPHVRGRACRSVSTSSS